jgi:hypothetical protein
VRVNSLDGSAIATGTIRGGHIAVGRDGRVHVAWNGSQTALPKGPVDPQTGKAGPAMLYARSNAGGTAFEPQRSVMQRSLTLDGGGTVSADPGGNVYVAWHGNDAKTGNGGEANRRIWIARSSDDGRTFATETEAWREPTGACSCCGMRLLATRGRGLNLLYRSATGNINRDIYLLSSGDRGRTFRGARIHQWEIAACPMTSMDLAEASGGVLAAWESEGQVFFGAVDTVSPGMSWKAAPASDVTGRKHPRLATGPGGQTLLVWTEGTAWARGGSLAWQIFNSKGEAIGPIERRSGMPTWSFGAAVPRGDGGFTVLY